LGGLRFFFFSAAIGRWLTERLVVSRRIRLFGNSNDRPFDRWKIHLSNESVRFFSVVAKSSGHRVRLGFDPALGFVDPFRRFAFEPESLAVLTPWRS